MYRPYANGSISNPSNMLADKVYNTSNLSRTYTNNHINGNYTVWKLPVKVATHLNIDLAGIQTINGVDLVYDDRVLVNGQTDPKQNGIYVVNDIWKRSEDFLEGSDASGAVVYSLGAINNFSNNVYFKCTSYPAIIGVDNIQFEGIGILNDYIPVTFPVQHNQDITIYDSTVDSQNNIYYIGSFNSNSVLCSRDGTVTYSMPNYGNIDNMIVVKMNPNGFVIAYSYLNQQINIHNSACSSYGYSIAVDTDFNVYVAGVYTPNTTTDLDITTFTTTPTASGYKLPHVVAGGPCYFVISWDPNGNVNSFTYSDTNFSFDYTYNMRITVDSAKNVYLAGSYGRGGEVGDIPVYKLSKVPDTAGFSIPYTGSLAGIFIIKWVPDGSVERITSMIGIQFFNSGQLPSIGLDVKIASNGDVVLGGVYRNPDNSNIAINSFTSTPINSGYALPGTSLTFCMFVIKWNSDGSVIGFTYSPYAMEINCLALDKFDDIYASCYIDASASRTIKNISNNPSDSSAVVPNLGGNGVAVVKWSGSSGNVLAYTYTNGDNSKSIRVDKDLNIYFVIVNNNSAMNISTFALPSVSTGISVSDIARGSYVSFKWSSNGDFQYLNYNDSVDCYLDSFPRATEEVDNNGYVYTLYSITNGYGNIQMFNQMTTADLYPTFIFPTTVFEISEPHAHNISSYSARWNPDGTVSALVGTLYGSKIVPAGAANSIQVNNPVGTLTGSTGFTYDPTTSSMNIGLNDKNAQFFIESEAHFETKNAEILKSAKDINIKDIKTASGTLSINTGNTTSGSSGDILFNTSGGSYGRTAGTITMSTTNSSSASGNFVNIYTGTSSGTDKANVTITAGQNIQDNTYDSVVKFVSANTFEFANGGLLPSKDIITANSPTVIISSKPYGSFTYTYNIAPESSYTNIALYIDDDLVVRDSVDPIVLVNVQAYSGPGTPVVSVTSYDFSPADPQPPTPVINIKLSNVHLTNTVNGPVTIAFAVF
jgi:hypothetical protein